MIIILVSISQLSKAKHLAKDQETSSSTTAQAGGSNCLKEGAKLSDFVERFLPDRTSPKFIGHHFDFVKIFLTHARLGELTEMNPYIKDYMVYFVECRQHGHAQHKMLESFVECKLKLYRFFGCTEEIFKFTALDFFTRATWTRIAASKGLELLGLKKEQEEICNNHAFSSYASCPASMVEALDRELVRLRSLKAIVERFGEIPQDDAFPALLGIQELATIINEIERIKAEASRLQDYRQMLILELEALLDT